MMPDDRKFFYIPKYFMIAHNPKIFNSPGVSICIYIIKYFPSLEITWECIEISEILGGQT